ncbi:putative ABC transporter permease subunit [Prosthecobacter sp.]|uniref:putative ABC transporter permease subunit n=1 Tax=Prosthecobacter sp. TaxID=1965333 RepID=UPI00378378CE
MTTASATWLLARTHGRMLRHKLRHGMRENKLLSLTVGTFLGLYSLAAYLLVGRGLEFMVKLPLIGPLLTERLVFLLFFFFLVMLVISNATITGMSLFRRKDMEWQIALPLPPRSLVLWKTLEGMLLASWGLLMLSTPILLALAQTYKADLRFMLAVLPALLALVTIAANVSTWLLIALVRWARRWMWKPVAAGAVLLLIQTLPVWNAGVETLNTGDMGASLNQILRHTEICMHPLLPSSWVAETIQAAGRGTFERAVFLNLVLLANAAMCILITSKIASAFYYPAWNRIMSAAPGGSRKPRSAEPQVAPERKGRWRRRILALDRASYALLLKEVRTFLREPVQWGQTAIIFSLLLLYSMNLRKLGYDLQSPFWITVVSHLNLLVCCLALSTLTTRFIYPQFSLEGQRLWILGLSPLPLHRVLALKLRLSASVLALIMVTLVVVSGVSLALPWQRILFFSASILMLSYGLTSLALSLGALVPNFKEANPARIVSGFGGTVCLIASFVYIVCGMVLLLIPSWQNLSQTAVVMAVSNGRMELMALGGLAVLTVVFGGIPYFFAKRQTKNLEYLRHL